MSAFTSWSGLKQVDATGVVTVLFLQWDGRQHSLRAASGIGEIVTEEEAGQEPAFKYRADLMRGT
jgi:hypothetical protein